VKVKALQSNSTSDYIPNLTQGRQVQKSNIIISAGFLLADSTKHGFAKEVPEDPTSRSPTTRPRDAPFRRAQKETSMGLTYAANESGCLGRRARRQGWLRRPGKEGHRRCRWSEDPTGRHLDRRGTSFCAQEGGFPGTKVLIDYSQGLRRGRQVQDGRREHDRPGTRKVLFQVCRWAVGLGTLKAAAAAHIWGNRRRQGPSTRMRGRVLTSRGQALFVDNGVFQAIDKAKNGWVQAAAAKPALPTSRTAAWSVGKINPTRAEGIHQADEHVQDEHHQAPSSRFPAKLLERPRAGKHRKRAGPQAPPVFSVRTPSWLRIANPLSVLHRCAPRRRLRAGAGNKASVDAVIERRAASNKLVALISDHRQVQRPLVQPVARKEGLDKAPERGSG